VRKISTNDDLMTTREAGEKLGVAVRTVQLWVEAGLLPAWRTAGGHRRISRDAVEALVAERAQMLGPVVVPSVKTPPAARILVVEDDPIMLRLTVQVIMAWKLPIELITAVNGFEGLLRIGEVRPDLVITDLNMPGMDGFQMLQTLKRPGSGYESLKVVVVSGLNGQEIAEGGGLPVSVTFLPKPVHYGELEALVRASLPDSRSNA
jgi:excisionase family DNA binding protein